MNALEVIKERLNEQEVLNLLNDLGFNRITKHYNTLRACCKVHGGNNPSAFTYSLEKHMWHCHSCGEGGDAVQLVEDILELNFKDATTYMLHRLGVSDLEGIEFTKRSSYYLKELEMFKSYANKSMVANRYYDTNSLNLKSQKIKSFRHFTEQTLEHFGLCYIKEMPFEKLDGTVSTIGNRLGMPIYFNGDVVGYSLRRIKSTDNPKWLFQPARLDKRNLIYNLEKRWYDYFIICEGQFDVWSYYQAGFTDVGCVLGSSITPEQVNLLSRCTSTLYLSFDGDEAGKKATHRAIESLKHKFDIYVIPFPDGKDACDVSGEELIECFNRRLHYTKWLIKENEL